MAADVPIGADDAAADRPRVHIQHATLADIVGNSPPMQRVRQLAERAARSSIPVLLEGERGVGKEFLARAVHGSGARRTRPFVTVRCDAYDDATIASVLFGDHAEAKIGGKLQAANGGTLFLDEIGALTAGAQDKLALVLAATCKSDTRLIAASSNRLVDLVAGGGFHRGLFDRLNVLPIRVPPLRERRADIPDLAKRLLPRLAVEVGGAGAGSISSEAMSLLVAQDWPGNIRDLERALLRAVMPSEGGVLVPQDFPDLLEQARGDTNGARAVRTHFALRAGVADQEQPLREGGSAASAHADRPMYARYGLARLLDERGEMRPIGALEEEVIRFAIGHYRGQMSEVARRLGIGRSTLYRKIKDYGIAAGEPVTS